MNADIRLKLNPRAAAEIANATQMRSAMDRLAEEGVEQVEAAAPSIVKQTGSRIYGKAENDGDGWYARVAVQSPFWHFPEYGHSRYPPRPYLRPTIQKLISRYGGRFKSQ